MKKLLSLPVIAVALALFWGGCASTTPPERANLALVGVQAANSTIFETTIEVTLRVTNETNRPLYLQGSTHKLTLNGSIVGRGVSNTAVEVAPLGEAILPVVFHLDNLKLFRQFSGGNIPQEISYLLDSRLVTAESTTGLPVHTDGSLDLRPYANSLLLN